MKKTKTAPETIHKKIPITKIISRILFLTIGSLLVATGLKAFFIPNQIIDGGVVGIALLLSHITHWSAGIFLFFLNIPFVILGYKQIGKTFAFSTLFGVTVMSLATTLIPFEGFTREPLLAAVFGGITLGIGVGMVIRYGGSLDGTEIVAILINKKSPFSVGEIVMFLNIFILGSAGFLLGWDYAMYSLIAYYIAFKVIDVTIEGFQESKSIWIISDKHKEIGEAILHRLGRGVTYLVGEGAYTGDDKKVVFCVITRLEEAKLKSIVEELDSSAFLAIGNIAEVKGGRFKKRDIH